MTSRYLLPGASRRSLLLGALALATALALGVGQGHAADQLRVGVMSGSEEEILEVVKEVAARDGLELEVVAFSDYVLPNEALNAGELDANAFQRSEEHTSELQSLMRISYAVFCLKKK